MVLEIALQKKFTNHRVSSLENAVATQYRHAKIGSSSAFIMYTAR